MEYFSNPLFYFSVLLGIIFQQKKRCDKVLLKDKK